VGDGLDDATVRAYGVGGAWEVSEERGESDFVMCRLLYHREDPQEASNAKFEVQRCQSATRQVGLRGDGSKRHSDVAFGVL